MFENLTVLAMAKKRMDWLAQRQQVLAQNIANADTPNYQPRDLKPIDFKQALAQTQTVAVTHPRHVAPAPAAAEASAQKMKKPYETAPDGNAVVLEEQMHKIGEARGAYDLAANLFNKQLKMLRTALGRS